jgi:CTP synthase (UTP-ammonia lyase)
MSSTVKIGIIGDLDLERPSHRATNDALLHSAAALGLEVEITWLPTESLEGDPDHVLEKFDGLWCSPGSPYKSMEGALGAIRFARENDRPFIGTCGGFQHAVLEFARNRLGMTGAGHAETDPEAPLLVITPLSCSLAGESCIVAIDKGSKVYGYYRATEVEERFHCNYGINPQYLERLIEGGLRISGTDANGEPRIMELLTHRFYVATLFQPQLSSTPADPHRLVTAFLGSAGSR